MRRADLVEEGGEIRCMQAFYVEGAEGGTGFAGCAKQRHVLWYACCMYMYVCMQRAAWGAPACAERGVRGRGVGGWPRDFLGGEGCKREVVTVGRGG